ncbi:hypothetical protein EJB05_13082 [Eragrostis curvula]|uniref:Uncharacterized protein n=1 Tax=Eragrostis curvula TaxID=38414 RepID=A0A5J9VVI3_9POAL|nr:hypothetical protein EJB05_13082 [Eragrostis curvula]
METAGRAVTVDRLVFALNGRRYEVAAGEVDPSMPLLEFIRTRTPFKGTKLGCGEEQHNEDQASTDHDTGSAAGGSQ